MSSGRFFLWLAAGALALSLACSHVFAQSTAGDALYTVEVPLDRRENDPRRAAYRRALDEVLVRVTGDVATAQSAEIQALFPDPGRYVLRYQPSEDQNLLVTLDGQAIERLLRQAGQRVWASDRPLTLVWLAVDWGQGERELVGAGSVDRVSATIVDRNQELRERLSEAARQRGLAVLFPLLDTQDLERVSVSDVWGGFDETLIDASRRYGTNSILVGRVRASAANRARWSYHSVAQRLEWSGTPEEVIAELAATFADEYAYAGNASVQTVSVTVSGVDSVDAYGQVQRMLEDLNMIESSRLETVAGADMRFVVTVRGGAERLAPALEFSGLLRRADWLNSQDFVGNGGPVETLGYLYQPQRSREDVELSESSELRSTRQAN